MSLVCAVDLQHAEQDVLYAINQFHQPTCKIAPKVDERKKHLKIEPPPPQKLPQAFSPFQCCWLPLDGR